MAFTHEQELAISQKGGNILLSAAAGSGKTTVLTTRAIEMMLDKEKPVMADRLLILTFTKAAASEMKGRIVDKLNKYINDNPNDQNARVQRNIIDRAYIGTIHSFCQTIIKENFNALNLPASFRIGDENELETILDDAIEEVLEKAYEERNEAFLMLSNTMSKKEKDTLLEDTIKDILKFSRSHPKYREWLKSKPKIYDNVSDFASSPWGKFLLDYAKKVASDFIKDMEVAITDIPDEATKYKECIIYDLNALKSINKKLDEKDISGLINVLTTYNNPGTFSAPKSVDHDVHIRCKAIRDDARDFIRKELKDRVFVSDNQKLKKEIEILKPQVEYLFKLVLDIDEIVQDTKATLGVIDFSDLEQMACNLLLDDNKEKTDIAKSIAESFDEVMVDEFQDVNEVQYEIISALSKGNNLFCVGDIKQSIYRFRMAQPELFMNMEKSYNEFEEEKPNFPAVIRLNGSFRQTEELTKITNLVFSSLMSEEVGEIKYDKRHELVSKGKYFDEAKSSFSINLISDETILNDEGDSGIAESLWVANEIKRLLKEGLVSDFESGKARPIKPSEIAILLRSSYNVIEKYEKALESAGLDYITNGEGGLLESREINTLVNLLKTIQNPLRDMELYATLVSPIFNFSDNEVASIRLKYKNKYLYNCLLKEKEENQKIKEFIEKLDEFRTKATILSPSDFITDLIKVTNFDVFCASLVGGDLKSANLNLFIKLASEFKCSGVPTLDNFILWIDKIREREKDLPSANVSTGKEAITITTMHSSKGLEWPVVFICNAQKEHSYYYHDQKERTILDSELGLAAQYKEDSSKMYVKTTPLLALRKKKEISSLSEELRLLYVSMTRAKEHLYITATVKDLQKKIDDYRNVLDTQIRPYKVLKTRNYLNWILLAIASKYDLYDDKKLKENNISINLIDEIEKVEGKAQEDIKIPKEIDKGLLNKINGNLSFVYPYLDSTRLPTNKSVSSLNSNENENYFKTKPDFLKDEKLTGSKKGTAIHAFMEECDFEKAKEDVSSEIERLVERGVLSKAQAEAIDVSLVSKFFKSDIYSRIERSKRVLREFPFVAPASTSKLVSNLTLENGESTMLRGIADCLFYEDDGIVVLDYKTDNMTDEKAFIENYQNQLLLYRDMLDYVMDIKVKECYIYSFKLQKQIKIY